MTSVGAACGCRLEQNGCGGGPCRAGHPRALGLPRHGLLGGAHRACPILVTLRLARGDPPQLRWHHGLGALKGARQPLAHHRDEPVLVARVRDGSLCQPLSQMDPGQGGSKLRVRFDPVRARQIGIADRRSARFPRREVLCLLDQPGIALGT